MAAKKKATRARRPPAERPPPSEAASAGAQKGVLATLERFHAKSRAGWRAWLETHASTSRGVWVVTAKKHTNAPRIEVADISEEALCFGWVDSKVGKVDEDHSMLLVTPRKPRSAWSALNKRRVQAMIEAGLMTPAGQAMIDLAKTTGTWSALDAVEALELPPDLVRRFRDEGGGARANFDLFPRSVKRGILEWLLTAKRPETRAQRIEVIVTSAAKNVRANQWRPR